MGEQKTEWYLLGLECCWVVIMNSRGSTFTWAGIAGKSMLAKTRTPVVLEVSTWSKKRTHIYCTVCTRSLLGYLHVIISLLCYTTFPSYLWVFSVLIGYFKSSSF
jgi:hypothetical protein